MAPPPLLVLGVRRSGTTLLRVMLDRNPDIAIPDESYFIPPLAARYHREVDPARFEDDLHRFRTLAKWGVDPAAVRARLRPGSTAAGAIAAIYGTYAADRGKARWGDKTPLYMGHLPLLDRLFPDAQYVHVIRDGRDAALSFLAVPEGLMTEGWGHPRDAAGFACQWRTEVLAGRELGGRVGPERYTELRYESLVGDPVAELQRICAFADLPWDPWMLDYTGSVDVAAKPHHRRLRERPAPGARDWRTSMAAEDVAAFESVAGDLLAALEYDLADRATAAGPSPRARARLAAYEAQTAAWRVASRSVARTPLWRRRHARLR